MAVSRLAEDVYAAIRTEPLGLAGNANSLFIVREDDVIVVDAQFTRAATLEHLAALRRITGKPVGVVVNTHWHDDHVAGNQVYQDTFPEVRFLAHPDTRADLIALGRPNREGTIEYGPATADRYQRLLEMGLAPDSTPASPAERAALQSALRIIREYFQESAAFREVLPDTTDSNRVVLTQGGRAVELRWFGRGNTRGDLVVWLPDEGIAATGDLLVHPIPFAFNAYPTEWMAALDSVAALEPRLLVPGHGPVQRDLAYLGTVRRMLGEAGRATRAAAAEGVARERLDSVVTLGALRAQVTRDDKWLQWMFDRFFRQPVVARYYEEARSDAAQAHP